MSSVIEKKKGVVQEITDHLQSSQTTVVVDYRGLDVAEVTALRKELRDAGVVYKVYKNSMTRRAIANVELDELSDTFVGPTAVDRKSTRLNSSHVAISYAVFCLKKKI